MNVERHKYDNQFYSNNVYGHALELIREYCGPSGIHLDLGCGFGRIAEPLEAATGLGYVGVDLHEEALASLRMRGLEAHAVDLLDVDAAIAKLQELIAGRIVASLSIIDTLEHLEDARPLLKGLRRIARLDQSPLVVSVPNVAHRDVGLKLAFGKWDYVAAGLLDDDHIRFYTNDYLTAVAAACGWREAARNDTRMASSEQRVPTTHPVLADDTSIRHLLASLRDGADDMATVYQLVRVFLPAPEVPQMLPVLAEAERPFLSVVMRTQGRRPSTLRDALLTLTAQTSTDFEVLLIIHKATPECRKLVERVVEDAPEWIRKKVTIHLLDDGNRTRPLNYGFAAARGQYMAILDDDDLPLGHWVETFKELAANHPGRVLRTIAVRQNVEFVEPAGGQKSLRATGAPIAYPATFDWIRHLVVNESPPVAVAFPRGAFHDLGIRFDEELTTTEDWDFMMRVVFVSGVASSPEVTSIYRWWTSDESSRTEHDDGEWKRNHERIIGKFDIAPVVLAPGMVADIRRLYSHAAWVSAQDREPEELLALKERLLKHLQSSSWKLTAPLRLPARLFGRRPIKLDIREKDPEVLKRQIRRVRRSVSWAITRPIRGMTGGRAYDDD